jgi:integrase
MPTIKEFAEQYLKHTKNAKRSWKDDESKFRLHIVPTLGHLTIDKLGVKEIDIYRNRIKDSHTNATANRHLALLSSMLSLAVSWELISKNPALGLKRFKEQAKHEGTLNSDEISRFLMALEAERNLSAKNALKTLLLTGLRRGEVSNVKWEHLDVKNQQLLLPMTKAGKARFVPISMDAMEIMQSQAKISEYVFYGQDTSKPINNLTKPFHRVLERAGITKAVRIHDLRHTFASLAVSNGVSLFHVQALLGHSSPQMTQRYAHLQTATLLEASSNTAKAIIKE